jgi:hypothetical protein
MLSMNVKARHIRNTLLHIESIVKKLNPALIYLYYQDTREGLSRIRNHRGGYWLDGMAQLLSQSRYGLRHKVKDAGGLYKFYDKQREIVDSVFPQLKFRKTAIEISGGRWTKYYRRMAAFLKTGRLQSLDLPQLQLMRCVGSYKERKTGNVGVISTDANSLYFHRSGAEAEKLLPAEAGTFSLQGLPIDLRFSYDRKGMARSMTFDSRMLNPRFTDTVWNRI